MKIHKEGYGTLIFVLIFLVLINLLLFLWIPENILVIIALFSFVFFLAVASFFRIPKRVHTEEINSVVAPADGKIVVIEKSYEDEYLKRDCLLISIFMSPANVHVNRYPISGVIQYAKYHAGKYLVAWHPKSSTDNERTTVVIANDEISVLVRQIAGKLARRIVCYAKPGEVVTQNQELGFIKFGSRVDVYMPADAIVNVALGEMVKGGVTVLAKLK